MKNLWKAYYRLSYLLLYNKAKRKHYHPQEIALSKLK